MHTEPAPFIAAAGPGSQLLVLHRYHKTLSCCFFLAFVVSINKVSHQFGLKINSGQQFG